MVRVGGGWMALDEFLVKNDPCRGKRSIIWEQLLNSSKTTDFNLMSVFSSVHFD